MSGFSSGKTFIVPTIILGLGAMTVASAQTASSPFAKKTKKQAWETAAPAPIQRQTVPSYTPPVNSRVAAPVPQNYQTQSHQPPVRTSSPPSTFSYPVAPSGTSTVGGPTPYDNYPANSGAYNYQAPAAQNAPVFTGQNENVLAGGQPQAPANGAYYPGRANVGQPSYSQYEAGRQAPAQQAPAVPHARSASWKDRLGFGGLKTSLKGFLRAGAAAVGIKTAGAERDWGEGFIGDGKLEAEVSAITQGGLEYGINLEGRAQYDEFRRGFGGRVGDCPAANPECASTGGLTPVAVRGHTSQFYTDGPSNAKEEEFALEGAYIFLRSAYGDVTLGRDDGAAYLFSLGAPSLLAVNGSNSPVDYTGLDSVKTVNDASGFSEKITYTSPRLLGDQIGVGVQLGVSYALNARACGVDYCVRENGEDVSGALSPDLDDVIEVGLSLDRTFNNGLKVEATGTYARASEQSGLAVFDDLSAWNTGVEISLADWTVGGSYLQSNNGLADGDYTAWDAGITWKPSQLGFSASYGQAIDDNVSLKSNQAVLGMTYEFDKFTLGTGIQYIERKTPFVVGGIREIQKDEATALFIEGGFKF